MPTTVTRSKFSERQAGKNIAVDVLALSPQARSESFYLPATAVVPLTTSATKVAVIPVPTNVKVTGAQLSYTTIPVMASGTGTIQIDYVAVDGSTTTNIVAATSILLLTAKIPLVLALATTNPAVCTGGGQLLITVVASTTVNTADVGGGLTISFENVEDAVINDTNMNTAQG